MRVVSLHVYPVKSTAPTDLDEALVEPWGLAGDRRWIVVDAAGNQITARVRPELLSVRALLRPGSLTLTRHGAPALSLPAVPVGRRQRLQVWSNELTGVDAGEEAARWFEGLLGSGARLVYQDDPRSRPLTKPAAAPGDLVSLADAYPLLLTSVASLARLNEWVGRTAADRGEPQPHELVMRRFRPNVVVDAPVPFEEDGWREVTLGEIAFRVASRCDRCVMTTVDPHTLARGHEPLRTLAVHRKWDGKTWFGVNLVPTGVGTIRVGDEVSATTSGVRGRA